MNKSEIAKKLRRIADDLEAAAVSVGVGGIVNCDKYISKRLLSPWTAEYYETTQISIELEYTESVAEKLLRESE